MRTTLSLGATALCLATLLACESGPPPEPHQTAQVDVAHPAGEAPRLDVAFCLDSTGSMQDLIDEAKARIREIDAELRRGAPAPSVRFGIVAYRDVGDAYVTRLYGFDPDVERVRAALGEIVAEGGGDGPEHVVAGLRRAVDDLGWDPEAAVRFLFLVGDAPPHLDYADSDIEPVLQAAQAKGIVIGSLVYGDEMSEEGHDFWRRVAGETGGLTEGVAGEEGGSLESTLLMAIRREAMKRGITY